MTSRKVPSPGAAWNRNQRRRGGWLCSAIAGDPKRGLGILNNDVYRGVVKRVADQKQAKVPDGKRVVELEGQVENLADAIASGALRASPALSLRLTAAEAELAKLRQQAPPREVTKLDLIIPRVDNAFRELVSDLPNAIKRDVDRARATVRQYTGNAIRVESDGKTVRFLSESRQMETTLLIAAGGAAAVQTSVVAGARFSSKQLT